MNIACPHCSSSKNSVIDSRPSAGNGFIRRRRECESCKKRFTTFEIVLKKNPSKYFTKFDQHEPSKKNDIERKLIDFENLLVSKEEKRAEEELSQAEAAEDAHLVLKSNKILSDVKVLKRNELFVLELIKKLIEQYPDYIGESLAKHKVIPDLKSQENKLKSLVGGFLPKNEMGTLLIFLKHFDEWFGEIIEVRRDYPDLIVNDKYGFTKLRVELEYKSSNFKRHRHDPKDCDYVVCWVHNTRLPMPVIELKTMKMFKPNEK